MATGGATSIGAAEMRAAVNRLPKAVTEKLRAIAWRTSRVIAADARQRLRRQQKTEAHALADQVHIVEDAAKRQFAVISEPPPGQPANVVIWNERGTRYMGARPYMRPSLDSARDPYRKEMEQESAAVVREVLE